MADAMMADAQTRVVANINYIHPSVKDPYIYYDIPPEGTPFTNMTDDPHAVEITDVRGLPVAPSLERAGFTYIEEPSNFSDFDDDEAVKSAFYAEIVAMVRRRIGVQRVVAYDYSIRRPAHGPARPDGIPVAGRHRRPVKRAHGDFTPEFAAEMVRRMTGDDAPRLLKGRVRAFNYWRPIRGPLTDAPLALCAGSSVSDDDLAPFRQFQPGGATNTIMGLRYNPAHRWYYMSAMASHEGVLFSSYDSARSNANGIITHCAFDHPNTPENGLPRDSIEVRVLAFED